MRDSQKIELLEEERNILLKFCSGLFLVNAFIFPWIGTFVEGWLIFSFIVCFLASVVINSIKFLELIELNSKIKKLKQ